MPRDREYADNAERQRAYRERKRAEEERLREEMRRLRGGGGAAARGSRHGQRRLSDDLLRRIARMLALITHPNTDERERRNAIEIVDRMVRDANLSWYDVLGVQERDRR